MFRRNISFVIVGLVAVLLTAFPMDAAKSKHHPKNLSEWLMSLSEEDRGQFERVVESNLERYRNLEEKSANAISEIIWSIHQEPGHVLPADKFAAFKDLTEKKPAEVIATFESVCGSCYWVSYWAEHGYYYVLDAYNICKAKFYSYCNPEDPGTGPGLPPSIPCVSLFLAEIYAERAMNDFWAAYTTCDCDRAKSGKKRLTNKLT